MATLKYKDEFGNFIGITAIQGPPGPQGPKGDTASGIKDIIASTFGFITVLLADDSSRTLPITTANAFYGTLLANGWSNTAPYEQTITVNGLLASDTPIVDVDLSETDNIEATTEGWSFINRMAVTADNTVTAYCVMEKPEVDVPFILKVVR